MIAILIYIVETVRRALRKLVRGVEVIVDSFHEAQNFRRSLPRIYMEE
jgi:hypothetical protein